jgi:nicotinamide mononucleotide (NMN) deamidase PncC
MKALFPLAETIARRLLARRETIAIAESSTGGAISGTRCWRTAALRATT